MLSTHRRYLYLCATICFCALFAIVANALVGCKSAPLTGRRQLLMVPESKEIALGASSYSDILSDQSPSSNPRFREMVDRVGRKIAAVSGRDDFQWEFRVIASPEKNAFCLPGGKVAVYEGILPICQSEAGLAVVMSHEVAHALARHGSERMSHGYVVNGVGEVANRLLMRQEAATRERAMKAYGLASEYGFVLPYSRKHESEADHIGVMLMAKAGYDPEEAPRFWRRFSESQTGERQPEFLSTHPTDERRARDLEALLPEAVQLYAEAPTRIGLGESLIQESGTKSSTSIAAQPDTGISQR